MGCKIAGVNGAAAMAGLLFGGWLAKLFGLY
jgi:hypothetical protein